MSALPRGVESLSPPSEGLRIVQVSVRRAFQVQRALLSHGGQQCGQGRTAPTREDDRVREVSGLHINRIPKQHS